MAKSAYRPFTPNPEQVALMPEVSGNSVNGLGEKEIRRPTYVYWHEPETLHHGEMQKWFYTQNMDHEGIKKVRAEREANVTLLTEDLSDPDRIVLRPAIFDLHGAGAKVAIF